MSGKFSFTGSGGLRVRCGGRALAASADVIEMGGRTFRLARVDRVAYHAAARLGQASYTIGLGSGGVRRRFAFDAFGRGTELEDARETWRRLVELLEATACPRLAEAAVTAISAGGKVKFGGGAVPRIDADAAGLRQFGPLHGRVGWDLVAGADLREGVVRVWTVGGERPLRAGMAGWNAVLLPRVVALMGRREMQSRNGR